MADDQLRTDRGEAAFLLETAARCRQNGATSAAKHIVKQARDNRLDWELAARVELQQFRADTKDREGVKANGPMLFLAANQEAANKIAADNGWTTPRWTAEQAAKQVIQPTQNYGRSR